MIYVIEMEVRIFYPKRTPEENLKSSWYMKVCYHNELPTVDQIKNDYEQLPISKEYWQENKVSEFPNCQYTLETLFEIFNTGLNPMSAPEMQQWIRDNKVTHTSMSVGDVVALDNDYFICDVEGWTKLEA